MSHERDRALDPQIRTLFHLGVHVHLTDAQLLERFTTREGEEAELAFTVLVERHGSMVLLACRSILRDDHDAQDAFQATFLILARRAATLWVNGSLGPWLHRVAYRVAVRSRLAVQRRKAAERKAAERKAAEAAPGRAAGEGRDDLALVLHEEINRLPDRYRLPIVLCDLQGWPHVDAARHLGCPVGTVKSRLTRARQRLRRRLSRQGLALSVALSGVAPSTRQASPAIPSALADATARAATHCVSGVRGTPGLVSKSTVLLMESELKAMLLTKVKAGCLALIVIGAVFGGSALPARQAGSPEALPRGTAAEPPRLKFEIRVWRNGKESREPIVVDVTEEMLYRIETEDASIQIRPRSRQESRARIESEIQRQIRDYERKMEELRRKLDQSGTKSPGSSKVVLDGIRGKIRGVAPSGTGAGIDLGSDDGLSVGQTLSVYRNPGHPQFIGKLLIRRTEPDWSTGKLIASEPGVELKKDDIVVEEAKTPSREQDQ